jgi:hypothetical protein
MGSWSGILLAFVIDIALLALSRRSRRRIESLDGADFEIRERSTPLFTRVAGNLLLGVALFLCVILAWKIALALS